MPKADFHRHRLMRRRYENHFDDLSVGNGERKHRPFDARFRGLTRFRHAEKRAGQLCLGRTPSPDSLPVGIEFRPGILPLFENAPLIAYPGHEGVPDVLDFLVPVIADQFRQNVRSQCFRLSIDRDVVHVAHRLSLKCGMFSPPPAGRRRPVSPGWRSASRRPACRNRRGRPEWRKAWCNPIYAWRLSGLLPDLINIL